MCFVRSLLCKTFQSGVSGSCRGDSGSPLVRFASDLEPQRYIQVGVLSGGFGECGTDKFPNLYARLEDPKVFDFIMDILKPEKSTFSTKQISGIVQFKSCIEIRFNPCLTEAILQFCSFKPVSNYNSAQ